MTQPTARSAELSIIVPTFNERDNVAPLVELLERTLDGIAWEVIFVDDHSPDGTAQAVAQIARINPKVRLLHRIGRRGLSSACVEGFLASTAPFLAVMDGDLQHDETLLPQMFAALQKGEAEIAIASRFAQGASVGNFSSWRQRISHFSNRLAHWVVRARLSDPMSGFFMLRREIFEAAQPKLSQQGFKILVDIFASSPRTPRFSELPLRFRERQHGESKLDTLVAWEYAHLLLEKLIGHIVPVRFILFSAIGGLGLVLHMGMLVLSLFPLGLHFAQAQALATVTAMTVNFFLNNAFTYRDQRLKGRRLILGLLSFYAVCGIGALANVGISAQIFEARYSWGWAGLAGALISAVWNYVATAMFTWKKK